MLPEDQLPLQDGGQNPPQMPGRPQASIWAHDGRALTGSHLRGFRRRERVYADRWLDTLQQLFPDQARDDLTTLLRGTWALLMANALHPNGAPPSRTGRDLLLHLALGGLDSLSTIPDGPSGSRWKLFPG